MYVYYFHVTKWVKVKTLVKLSLYFSTTKLRGWGKRGTAAHIFNFSTKYRVSGESHVSLRKEPTVSFKQ